MLQGTSRKPRRPLNTGVRHEITKMKDISRKKFIGGKTVLLAFLWAIPLSLASFAIETNRCMDGPGWGWPFQFYYINHDSITETNYVFDPIFVIFNIPIWALIAYLFLFVRAFFQWRRFNKEKGSNAEPNLGGDAETSAPQD